MDEQSFEAAQRHWQGQPISIDIYCDGRKLRDGGHAHQDARFESGNFAYVSPLNSDGSHQSYVWVYYGQRSFHRRTVNGWRQVALSGVEHAQVHLSANRQRVDTEAEASRTNYNLECRRVVDPTRRLRCRVAIDLNDTKLVPVLDTLAAQGVRNVSFLDLAATLRRQSDR